MEFTHYNEQGRAKMVDVTPKQPSERVAIAESRVLFSTELYEAIMNGTVKKGDPLPVAQVAGVMAAKQTSNLIPMCHPLLLQGIDLTFSYQSVKDGYELHIQATVKVTGNTGVEMEALMAVSVAALTFYDMCKAVDKKMVIKETKLISKSK